METIWQRDKGRGPSGGSTQGKNRAPSTSDGDTGTSHRCIAALPTGASRGSLNEIEGGCVRKVPCLGQGEMSPGGLMIK